MKMNNRITSYLSIALSIFIIAGCSSGNPTTPNKANLTNLAKIPSTTADNDTIKKINLSGRVLDSVTRKPIENASVLIYVIANDEVVKSIKNGTTPASGTPASGSSASPSAGSNPNPGSEPNQPIVPDAVNTPGSAAPSVVPDSGSNPAPYVEEDEERSTNPSPNPNKNKKAKVKTDTKTEVKSLPQPTPLSSPSAKAKDKNAKDLDENDIISALTTLKINDIQEFNSSTGNDGKFWISKVPDSNIIMTVNAKDYKTVSIFNSDTSKVEDILLEPITNKQNITSVLGSVISATDNPVEDATISASYVINESFSIPSNSNKMGAFQIEDVSLGERTFIATIKDETGKIVSMGATDFTVVKPKDGDKKKVLPTPSPKPTEKATTENEEEAKATPTPAASAAVKEEVKPSALPEPAKTETKASTDDKKTDKKAKEEEIVPVKKADKTVSKDYPLIKVKSVTDYVDFKGKINLPEGTTLKGVNVYYTFKKKGQSKEEIFLTDKQLDSTDESFELSLPAPEFGYYYHLEFVAVNKKGSFIYHHEYNLKKENKEMKVSFMQPLIAGKTDFIEKDGEKLPIFTWMPVEGASFYKVSLDKIDKDNNLTTVWEGITPFNTAIYPITTGSAKLDYTKSTYNWSVVAIKEGSSSKGASDKLQFSKLNITTWSDLSHSPHMAFTPTGDDGSEEIEEIDNDDSSKKKEG
jgi:hypothetical protein